MGKKNIIIFIFLLVKSSLFGALLEKFKFTPLKKDVEVDLPVYTKSEDSNYSQQLHEVFLPDNNPYILLSKREFDEKSERNFEELVKIININVVEKYKPTSKLHRASMALQRGSLDAADIGLSGIIGEIQATGQHIFAAVNGAIKSREIIEAAQKKLESTKKDLSLQLRGLKSELNAKRASKITPREEGDALEVLIQIFQEYSSIIDYFELVLKSEQVTKKLNDKEPVTWEIKKDLLKNFDEFNRNILKKSSKATLYKLDDIIQVTIQNPKELSVIDALNIIVANELLNKSATKKKIQSSLKDYFEGDTLDAMQKGGVSREVALDSARRPLLQGNWSLLKLIHYFDTNEKINSDGVTFFLKQFLKNLHNAIEKISPKSAEIDPKAMEIILNKNK